MKQTELVAIIASRAGLNQAQAGKALKAVVEGIQSTLSSGGEVSIVGFGSFKTINRQARRGVNPQTREAVQIPSKRVAVFRPGKALKDAVK
jgi:DNA-binding protein HU-beta